MAAQWVSLFALFIARSLSRKHQREEERDKDGEMTRPWCGDGAVSSHVVGRLLQMQSFANV